MIIRYLDFPGIRPIPSETNPPLIIDPDAVLSFPITFELFQPVSGRLTQVLNSPGVIQHPKFS